MNVLLNMKEKNAFFRALSSWVGFKTTEVPFEVQEREAGESKWSVKALTRYAISNITSFSAAPMQIVTFLGVVMLIVSVVLGAISIGQKICGVALGGFTTVIIIQLFTGSIIMISLGIIGYYIAKIYDEVKGRPRYIIASTCGSNHWIKTRCPLINRTFLVKKRRVTGLKTIVEVYDADNRRPEIMEQAGEILKSGGLVAFPTETVYGLGGDALNPEASAKIYAAKGRPSDNPLIVHIADMEALKVLASEVPEKARLLADRFWPGPLTMIMPKSDAVPYATTGGLDTVAIRMPSHPTAYELIRSSGVYIAAPSANTSGRPKSDNCTACL